MIERNLMEDIKIQQILNAIRSSKEFRLEFGNIAPEILDKIYSYYSNENCSCKGAIREWIIKNENKITGELINKHKQLFDESLKGTTPTQIPVTTVPQTTPSLVPNMRLGELYYIERTQEAYKNFHNMIKEEKWVFRGLTIVPDIKDGKEVWAIFTY